jgi:ABC-type Mn2+/Zn2+ transport system ATPase subunit
MGDHQLVIEMTNYQASYKGFNILKGLNFRALSGEVIAVLGENGAGKTTFFRAVMQLMPYQSGSIRIMGRSIHSSADKRWARSLIGYVPQSQGEGRFPISVQDAVLLGRWGTSFSYWRRPRKSDREAAVHMLEAVGLQAHKDKDCRSLSGGQKQRLHIARALVRDPKILLLDEPTTYLDADSQEMLTRMISELPRSLKVTIVMITHERSYAERIADRLVYLEHGTLQEKQELVL